jgi:hypothetical protein
MMLTPAVLDSSVAERSPARGGGGTAAAAMATAAAAAKPMPPAPPEQEQAPAPPAEQPQPSPLYHTTSNACCSCTAPVSLLRALHVEGLPLGTTAARASDLLSPYGSVQYAEAAPEAGPGGAGPARRLHCYVVFRDHAGACRAWHGLRALMRRSEPTAAASGGGAAAVPATTALSDDEGGTAGSPGAVAAGPAAAPAAGGGATAMAGLSSLLSSWRRGAAAS